MLSRKVDLTENREFSGGNSININRDIAVDVDRLFINSAMSTEDYEKLVQYEKFFGRKRHFTDALEVFENNKKYSEELRTHCHKCGNELRIPWKTYFGLCKKCNDHESTFTHTNKRKYPWTFEQQVSDRDARDILYMR